MKAIRTAMEADIIKYEPDQGIEDGFELFSDVVTDGWIVTDSLIKLQRPNGDIVCPYILHRRGRTFIGVGDYVILSADGTKQVCGEDKIHKRYTFKE